MSLPGGKKGAKIPASKKASSGDDVSNDRNTPATSKDSDIKDDTSSNGGGPGGIGDKSGKDISSKVDSDIVPSKPQSAGATTRDGAQKLLNLAMKSEWTPVDNSIKQLEKAVAAGGEEVSTTPLAGVMDPVSISISISNQNLG